MGIMRNLAFPIPFALALGASGCTPRVVHKHPTLPPVVRRHAAPEAWERDVLARVERANRVARAADAARAWQREIAAVTLVMLPSTEKSSMSIVCPILIPNTGGAPLPPTPAAPSDLAVHLISTPAIALEWTDNSSNESGFEIQRSTDGSTWGGLATVAMNTVWYEDESGPGTFWYRVRAVNATTGLSSDWSNIAGPITQP